MYMQLLRKYFNYNKHDPKEFSIKYYIFTMLCSSIPRIALLCKKFQSNHVFCAIYFLDIGANAVFRTKSK